MVRRLVENGENYGIRCNETVELQELRRDFARTGIVDSPEPLRPSQHHQRVPKLQERRGL